MSYRKEYLMSLAGRQLAEKSTEELQSLFKKTLNGGMHGLCFSPYLKGQGPGTQLTEEQIRRRMEIIKPYTKWIRSFSCTDGNELIPRIAHEYGIKTLVGLWLGTNPQINQQETTNAIELAKAGYADIVAVGNEVMYRGDLSQKQLLQFIQRVKTAIPETPIGYVDAYYEFENRPEITQACDVILANCYPFWEGCALQYSLLYMQNMYYRTVKAAKGKRVIISETGWPNTGNQFHGAQPSFENAIKYFINAQQWSKQDDIELFYFSSFDESWKVDAEGDVGAYWGLWDENENLKY